MKCKKCGGENCQTFSAILETQITEGVEQTKSLGFSASPFVFSAGAGKSKSKIQSVLVKNIIKLKPATIGLFHPIGGFLFIYFVSFSFVLHYLENLLGLRAEIDFLSIWSAFAVSIFLTAITTYYLWVPITEQVVNSQNEFRSWKNTWHCNSCSHRW